MVFAGRFFRSGNCDPGILGFGVAMHDRNGL